MLRMVTPYNAASTNSSNTDTLLMNHHFAPKKLHESHFHFYKIVGLLAGSNVHVVLKMFVCTI